MKRLLAPLAVLVLAAQGCVTTVEKDVDVAAAPKEDEDYAPALAKATQSRRVLKDFETRYDLTATYLSPAFRAAFAKRLERVYKQGQGALDEASSKAGFFVSITAPGDDKTDLTNPSHWTILLTAAGQPAMKPVLIKKLNDKERWRAFFDTVTEWTSEYLVVFDTPSVDTASPALVEKSPMSLTFANADAQVNLAW